MFAVAERRELAVLNTGPGPREIAVAPDGRTAVITNYGHQDPGHTLTVVDVVRANVVDTVDLSNAISPRRGKPGGEDGGQHLRPHGVQFVSSHQVVVTSEATHQLLLINIKTGLAEHAWPTDQPAPHMVAVTRDGQLAAISSFPDGAMTFLDLERQRQRPDLIPLGAGAIGLAVHPTTGDAWVANRGSNTISFVSRKTRRVEAVLATGDRPCRLVFTPDGKQILVTCTTSGELQVFDAQRRTLVREISMHGDRSEQSSRPRAVACGPDQRFAYVACTRGEFIAIIDLEGAQYVDRLDARRGPSGIAYARPRAATEAGATRIRR